MATRYVAAEHRLKVRAINISVEVKLDGDPIKVTEALLDTSVQMADGSDSVDLIKRTSEIMAMNSLKPGIAVTLRE